MLNFIETMKMKLEEKTDAEGGGAPETKPPEAPPVEDAKVDEFGYEKIADEKPPESKEDPKKVESKPDEEVKTPATGYGEKPPEVPEEKKVEPPPAEKPPEDELKLDVAGLEESDIKDIKEFVNKHKVSKEAAQELVDAKKAEVKKDKEGMEAYLAEQKRNAAQQRKDWDSELRNDPTFGGEKFSHNVKQVEKVLDQFMPNLKKKLTETGTMLPSYVMRDLAALGKHLYSSEKLAQGDPKEAITTEDKSDDPLSFYV